MMLKLLNATKSLKLLAAASALALSFAAAPAGAEEIETLVPGKLTIGMLGDMPMTSIKDGKVIGTDGALAVKIAESLGLEVETLTLEWNSLIQATTQGQADLLIGSVGWTEERSKVMLLSDPVYFFGTLLIQKKENSWDTFEDMKDRTVGTVTGFTLVPELKGVEGIGEVKLYETQDAVLRDIVAGRLDMGILDPSLVEYAINQNPDWGIHQIAVQPQPEKYPIMSKKYYSIFATPTSRKPLADAVNAQIAKFWEECTNVQSMAAFGLGDKSWFTPPEPDYRGGVDRPEGWTSPKSPDSCFQ